MMRKQVLILSLLTLLLALPASAQPQGRRPGHRRHAPKKELCAQLYNYRHLIGDSAKYAANHVEVFKQLKEMGFDYIEAACYNKDGRFYGVSPEQFKKDCQDAGLTPLSSHATHGINEQERANHDFTEVMKWWTVAIDAHKRAGFAYLVSPWTPTPKTEAEAQTICDYHNEVGQRCAAAGIKYGYHNHSGEFQNKVGEETWYDFFMQHTDPQYVFSQLDVYWTMMAQKSPVECFKKYPGRFKLLHIKDKHELGESGMVGFDAIFRYAETAGLEHYVVEIENTDGTIDIMEATRRSAEYLNRSPFVKASYAK